MRYKQIYRKPISNLINYKFAFIKVTTKKKLEKKKRVYRVSLTSHGVDETGGEAISDRESPSSLSHSCNIYSDAVVVNFGTSSPSRHRPCRVSPRCELSLSMQRINTLCLHRFDSAWCFYDMSSGLCFAQIRKKMGLFLLMFHLLGLMEKGSSTVCIFKWET
ncbi:BnaAnng03440D [Brassica napus]|uniref:(rape) hypothetical protein n=1 Tax=Brassica napus TaxID=3708 RepID=A0A078GX01_BRANA|nr:unnamed protein product [Brassica napus]CDY29722.1 BnaAnng03440D [Brassica napus]